MDKNNSYIPSGVYSSYMAFTKYISQESPIGDNGKHEYYTNDLRKNAYKNKEGRNVEEYVFSLCNHKGEEVQIAVSKNAIIKYSKYFYTSDKPSSKFIGKSTIKDASDFKGIIKDATLADFVGDYWFDMYKEDIILDNTSIQMQIPLEQELEIEID